jgi:hypothetical protein
MVKTRSSGFSSAGVLQKQGADDLHLCGCAGGNDVHGLYLAILRYGTAVRIVRLKDLAWMLDKAHLPVGRMASGGSA